MQNCKKLFLDGINDLGMAKFLFIEVNGVMVIVDSMTCFIQCFVKIVLY